MAIPLDGLENALQKTLPPHVLASLPHLATDQEHVGKHGLSLPRDGGPTVCLPISVKPRPGDAGRAFSLFPGTFLESHVFWTLC